MANVRSHKYYIPFLASLFFVLALIFFQMNIDVLPHTNTSTKQIFEKSASLFTSVESLQRQSLHLDQEQK